MEPISVPWPFQTVLRSARRSIAIVRALRTSGFASAGLSLLRPSTTSPLVVPDSVVNRVVSENCGSASGACRLEITSRLPDSMDAFMAFGSEK